MIRSKKTATSASVLVIMVALGLGGAGLASAVGGNGTAGRLAVVNHTFQPKRFQTAFTPAQKHTLHVLQTADVSTRAGAWHLLRALGIDPHGVVIQRGKHNYAGPTCPGKGWTCTKATRVLQTAGDDEFECTSGGTGSPDTCVVVQMSGGSATCTERTKATLGLAIVQACTITQGPNPAGNVARVEQSANQKDRGSCLQDVTQTASVMQTQLLASAASNSSSIKQSISQDCKMDSAEGETGQNQAPGETRQNQAPVEIRQNQEAHQIADVTQNSDSGNNRSNVEQSQDQDEKAKNATAINQFQNTDERFTADCPGAENLCYRVSQDSASSKNRSDVVQTLEQSQDAKKALGGRQAQGACMPAHDQFCSLDPSATGLLHAFSQQSSGVSTQRSDQNEKQIQRRKDTGTMTATQVGPTRKDQGQQCCNAADRATQFQDSKQDSKGGAAVVSSDILSDTCSSFFGLCTVHQSVDANGFRASNDLTAPAFTAEIACTSAGTTTTAPSAPSAPTGACTPTTTTVNTNS